MGREVDLIGSEFLCVILKPRARSEYTRNEYIDVLLTSASDRPSNASSCCCGGGS
jgi:hypothetical protein